MSTRPAGGGIGAAGAFAGLLCMGAAPDPGVDYEVTPVVRNGALQHLRVEMLLRGDADGVTRLHLGDWGHEPNPWSKVTGFEALGAEVVQQSPAIRNLLHRPGARVTLRYRVMSAHAALPPPDKLDTLHRPLILPGLFGVYGETVFALPEGRETEPCPSAAFVEDLGAERTTAKARRCRRSTSSSASPAPCCS